MHHLHEDNLPELATEHQQQRASLQGLGLQDVANLQDESLACMMFILYHRSKGQTTLMVKCIMETMPLTYFLIEAYFTTVSTM